MKTAATLRPFLLAAFLAPPLLPALHAGEWINLFDGKTLDGWFAGIEGIRPDTRPDAEKASKPVPAHLRPADQRGEARYFVEDGAIVGEATNYCIHAYLFTKREFGDFEFECEFFCGSPGDPKMRSVDSGIQIRSKWDAAKPVLGRLSGVQLDINPGNVEGGTTGVPYGEHIAPGGWLTPDKKPVMHKHYKAGEWNKLRIVAQGPRIQTWVNGEPVTDVALEETTKLQPSGHIGLQVHEILDPGPCQIRWRNVRLRELGPSAPAPE